MDATDTTSPEAIPDLMEALALGGAFGIGGPVPMGGLLKTRPDLLRRFAQLDPVVAAGTFGGLLTVPSLQANGVRVEALVHLSVALCRGGRKPDEKFVADAFRHLGAGLCGRMEDPAEDVLVGAVRSPWGNFRVLEGLWEGGCFHLQRFVDVIADMPEERGYDAVRAPVVALLRLAEAVCERARLQRFELGAEMPADTPHRRVLAALLLRRRHLRFTNADLDALGVDPDDLSPFTFNMDTADGLRDEAIGASSLERYPLLRAGDVFHLVLPTAVSSAIRYYVVAAMEAVGWREQLTRALALGYSELFSDTALLGGARPPVLSFRPGPNGAFAEAMMQVDVGRYVHFLFFTDPLVALDETGLAGINPASMGLGDEFDRRIGRARDTAAGEADFRGGLTVVVGCGIGRGVATAFGATDWPGWRVVSCSAYDLVTLSWTPDFTPRTLWRILDARDRLATLGVQLQNINGLINLVAWSRGLDGHLVPHGDMPDGFTHPERAGRVAIVQNGQRGLRHESLTTYDARVERFINGRWIAIRKDTPSIFADDRAAPFYASEESGESGKPMSVFLASRRAWWADVSSPPDASPDMAYERWRLVGTWLARAAPVLDAVSGLPDAPVLWNAMFETAAATRALPTAPPTYEQARAAIEVAADLAAGVVTLRIGEAWEVAQFHPLNIAERALVAALVHGVAMLAKASEPAAVEAAMTPQIVPNDQARHGHAFTMRGFRDMVRPDLHGQVVMISREDDASTRLGLGWQVRERAAGGKLNGEGECRPFLTALVRHIEDDIVAALRRFDRRAMLDRLLRNHELAVFDRDRWKRTSAAMIGLHGNTPETLRTITDHEFKLNAVFQATRIIAEIAICECPPGGGARPGQLDLSLLLAKAALLVQVGGWSDAMRWGLMKPELRITPLGDVHANFGFIDDILVPHGRVVSEGRIADAAKAYAENLEDRPVEVSVAHKLDPVFGEAWSEQFGATIDQTRILIDFIEDLGAKAGKAVIAVPRSRLSGMEVEGQVLDDSVAAHLVDLLTLASRPSWRELPEGFPDKDRQPWRLRRRLSLLRRPLLRVDDAEDPTILFAPGMVRDAFAYMMGNYHHGDFADYQLSPKMKAWAKREGGARGTIFAEEVAAALREAGWRTEVEVKITKLLRNGLDRDYGDVDVLAWREGDGRVLAIECKDVQFRKSFGEISEQIADYRGELRSNGKPDYLLKHLNRMDVIRANIGEVSRFVGIDPLVAVESHLMFRHPVPMEFALERLAEKVVVSRFDRIGKI